MDEVSPDFSTALVETKSWTEVDRNQGDDKELGLDRDYSPTRTCDEVQIIEAHTVVDINSTPLDSECAKNESDCSVAEVYTPRIVYKEEDTNGETTLPTSVETLSAGIDESDLEPPAKKRSISAYPEQFIDDDRIADGVPSANETTAPPMLFGSFVDPGKADPNIAISLESADLWHQFYQAGTEMIITKSGR